MSINDYMELTEVVERYGKNKDEEKILKKKLDSDGKLIKSTALETGENSFSGGGYIATVSETKKESFNEEKLIQYFKDNNINLVKTVEVIDYDALENELYVGNINPETLARFTNITVTQRLTIKKEK